MAYLADRLPAFLATLRVVAKEARLLAKSRARLVSSGRITGDWVERLETDDARAEQVEAFASRFARMQDTVVDRLLPRLWSLEGTRSGSAIDSLNRAERAGLITSAARWLEIRGLRNAMVHEYMEDPSKFAAALNRADAFCEESIHAYRQVRSYARDTLGIDVSALPEL